MASPTEFKPAGTPRAQSPSESRSQSISGFCSNNRSTASLSNTQRRHSYNTRLEKSASHAAKNQRVAQILQSIGNPYSVNGNRNNNQFYASSAPSSTVSLSQRSSSARPPVPLFPQSTGNVHQSAKMMNAADVVFDGGASTAFSSPAVRSSFDFNGSMSSSSASNLGTISPQDLLIQEPFMSAPNSAALTALTSPSLYNESPEFDGYDVSPNFGNADFDGVSDPWYPLFPQDSGNGPEQTNLEDSPAQRSDDVDSVGNGSGIARKKVNGSPTSAKHSSVAGVNARKRDKPLPPIVIDNPNDTVAMKRARNTLAARKSRERKAQRFEDLEDKIAKLEAERDHWKRIALSQGASQN
ncbi:hypothetical protein Golomagni_07400 [Golovinomyces magnicellulatus]|nr:hypothetical protein Golomagni_07400 [Golovinomyces magnicellulatus]